MEIRYVCSDEERRTDRVLSAVAERAARTGITLAGTVQPHDAATAAEKCHIVLALLPDGEKRDISFPMQPGMTGCRLNAGALEDAVMVVHERLPAAQALFVNKFGKQEAAGRGLVAAIGEACERGIPVLVGVAPAWRDAFLAFAGEAAIPLAAEVDLVFDWLLGACGRSAAA